MYDTIVVPTDGSEHAEQAARRGFALAREHDAAVHVVCAADTGPIGDVRLPGDDASAAEAFTERATRYVERTAELADRDDLDVTTAVIEGPAKDEIVDYASAVSADLIAMGTRGRGGVERLMLGSVTEHVVRTSDVDVLVVHTDGDPDGGPDSDAAAELDGV